MTLHYIYRYILKNKLNIRHYIIEPEVRKQRALAGIEGIITSCPRAPHSLSRARLETCCHSTTGYSTLEILLYVQAKWVGVLCCSR